jgi:hypothetical protein
VNGRLPAAAVSANRWTSKMTTAPKMARLSIGMRAILHRPGSQNPHKVPMIVGRGELESADPLIDVPH